MARYLVIVLTILGYINLAINYIINNMFNWFSNMF